MVKSKKKEKKKVTEKKFDSVEIIEPKESINEKITEFEDKIDNQKFLEFLSVSTESIETLASKKPRNAKPIEQDQDVLSVNLQEEDKKEKKEIEYIFSSRGPDYNLTKANKENIGPPLIKAASLEMVERNIGTFDSPQRGQLISNTELSKTTGGRGNYIIPEEIIGKEIKYKSRKFR